MFAPRSLTLDSADHVSITICESYNVSFTGVLLPFISVAFVMHCYAWTNVGTAWLQLGGQMLEALRWDHGAETTTSQRRCACSESIPSKVPLLHWRKCEPSVACTRLTWVGGAQEELSSVKVNLSRLMKDWPGYDAHVEVYRTSVGEDGLPLTAFSVPATMLGFAFALYPQSITTFVISKATLVKRM